MFMRGAMTALLAALAIPIATAGAQESLRLEDALWRVIDGNAKLAGQPFALAGAEARRDRAALRPAYEVGFEAENVLGTGSLRTFGDLEATLSLSTVIELGGKRAGRIDAAERERDLVAIENAGERIDILAEAARRFILLVAEQEGLTLASEARDLAERTVAAVKARIAGGRASPVDEGNAALALVRADIALDERRAAVAGAWASLAASWGGAPEPAGTAIGTLMELPVAEPFAALAQAVDSNPGILRFAGARRVDEARLRLAETERLPDLSAGLGLRRLQATKDQALVLGVSVPLGAAERSRPAEREAASRIEQSRRDETAARAEITATLYTLYRSLENARETFGRLRTQALPAAESIELRTDEGYRAGRFSLLELTVARAALLDVRERAVAAAATYHQLFLEIERLTGRPLDPSARPAN
jgi:cobalt-zinc-cadmium efflux system outer membrane protein